MQREILYFGIQMLAGRHHEEKLKVFVVPQYVRWQGNGPRPQAPRDACRAQAA